MSDDATYAAIDPEGAFGYECGPDISDGVFKFRFKIYESPGQHYGSDLIVVSSDGGVWYNPSFPDLSNLANAVVEASRADRPYEHDWAKGPTWGSLLGVGLIVAFVCLFFFVASRSHK